MKTSTGININAGSMRAQIVIQKRVSGQGTSGEPSVGWDAFATRRAEVLRTPGHEVFSSQQRTGRIPTMWKVRYLDGVQPSMRIVYRTRVYNILSAIDPTGRREELVITAEELVEEVP